MAKTVIGMFDDRAEAQAAVEDLVREGFAREHIGLAAREYGEADQREGAEQRGTHAASGAGIGAGTGAVLGGLGGLLVGLGLLAIPGLGPLVAAGPIAAALAGAGVGAAVGGIAGALVGMGVPKDEAEYYAEGVRRGGTLVTLQTDDAGAERGAEVMRRHAVVDVKERAAEWRRRGWTGYDPNAAPYTAAQAEEERSLYGRRPQSAAAQPAAAQQAVMEREAEASRAPQQATSVAAAPGAGRGFEDYESAFKRDFETKLSNQGFTYERHVPAYRYGYYLATDPRFEGRDWNDIVPDARDYWEERNPGTWDQFSSAIRHAWGTVTGKQ